MRQSVVLLDQRDRRYLVPIDRAMATVRELGTLNTKELEGMIGRRLDIGDRTLLVLEPSRYDRQLTMERGPQTMTPKDIAVILFYADIGPSAKVVEAGCGSGALTVALADVVRPSGRIFAYDTRRKFLAIAQRNVDRSGLSPFVEFREGDVRHGIPDHEVDAVILDLPDPWAAVNAAWAVLRPCGHLATFSPNMEQVKETVASVRARPFVDVRTVEIIEREIVAHEAGTHPSFAPLGHTGYLTFARKVLDTF